MRFWIALSVMLLVASPMSAKAQGVVRSDDHATSGLMEADFFVASDSEDQNPGTIEKPFQSLERARDAVRELKRGERIDGPIVVMLRGGTYRFFRSVVFSDQDSGTEQSPITYKAYPGEQPVLRIRQWRVVNDFACGPESWGMADYRPVLDQLAKLKFKLTFSILPAETLLMLLIPARS